MTTKQALAADAMVAMATCNVGYSQGVARTGLRGVTPRMLRDGYVTDTDCSFSVAWALAYAGLIPQSVLSGTIWTGNQAALYAQYGATNLDWDDVGIYGLQMGDVLLSNGHTAMVVTYDGSLQIAEASINEFGDIVGGALGDQTGGETKIGPLRRGYWHTVQRWPITQADGSINPTDEEAELMAAKDDIIKALRADLSYQNEKIAQLRSDIGTTQKQMNALQAQMEEVRKQLHYDVGRAQTMVTNVSDGMAYQNSVYMDPIKQAVARIDGKVK